MRVWWFDIPKCIRFHFYNDCGFDDYCQLQEYGCLIRENGRLFIDFESEAHYQWFVLRYS